MEKKFSVQDSNVAKGVAVLLLLFHHLFYTVERYKFATFYLYNSDGVPWVAVLALQARVCVAIFLILSGYGIAAKLTTISPEISFKKWYGCCISSLKKLMCNFWIVFIIFVPIGTVLGKTLQLTYGNDKWINLLFDFMGITYLTKTPSMNGAWWYVSIAIIAYLVAPLYKAFFVKTKAVGGMLVILYILGKDTVYPYEGIWQVLFYVMFFAAGMYFFENSFLNKVRNKFENVSLLQGVVTLSGYIFCFMILRQKTDLRVDVIGGILIIIWAVVLLEKK